MKMDDKKSDAMGFKINFESCIGKITFDNLGKDKNHYIQVIKTKMEACFEAGYSGYIFEGNTIPDYINSILEKIKVPFLTGYDISKLYSLDVCEINSLSKTVRVLYSNKSNSNTILLTKQCNCNCIMCPDQLEIRNKSIVETKNILALIQLIDCKAEHICLSGGEPTLLKQELFGILDECKRKLPHTNFTFLTNARMFSNKNYTREFNVHRPNEIIVGVAIYGHTPEIHDSITDTMGSFIQTINGIKNLLEIGIKVEIRIVVSKVNYEVLPDISRFILDLFPSIYRVNLMGLEMLGNAVLNNDRVWVDFNEIKDYLRQSAIILLSGGIITHFYNFPLCYLDESFWSISRKSISDYKVRFYDECERCTVKNICGGFFNSTSAYKKIKVFPVLKEKHE